MFHQLAGGGIRFIQQAHTGSGHFAQVVRRNVGGHANRNAGGAIQQYVRQTRRHDLRFFKRAVEVRLPLDRALLQFAQQHLRVWREARLGVAHGGKTFRVVRRTPVALAVDQRIAIAERLGHEHHGFVTGAVAVRVELSEHIAHGARRLLVLGGGRQPEFRHGVHDAPLHRLQAVGDVRQRAVQHHVHRVIEVGLLGKSREWQALDVGDARARLERRSFAALGQRFLGGRGFTGCFLGHDKPAYA